jgi:hypothetical protein
MTIHEDKIKRILCEAIENRDLVDSIMKANQAVKKNGEQLSLTLLVESNWKCFFSWNAY